ncbi:HD domain-containing protein [Mucilaginibacter sp. HD30]
MEDTLQKIIAFADKAHDAQMRKYTPERYIVHPVRVMKICREYTANPAALAAAVLHDVLEDTQIKAGQMLTFLYAVMDADTAVETVKLVEELTDVYTKEAYPQWNRKKRKAMEAERTAHTSAMAQTIKYADVLDNSKEIAEYDPNFGPRFLKECRELLQKADKGDAVLRQKAQAAINAGLKKLSVR